MRPKALIVDDEAPARAELRYLLEEIGQVQVVGEATNGEEALLLLGSLDYDLVLLDVRMPGGSGLEVAAALRRQPDPPKVIFTTAYPDHAVDAFDLAAADYLLKPFDADRLRRALERALRPDDGTSAGAGPGSAASAPPSGGAVPGGDTASSAAGAAGSAGTADTPTRGDVEPLVRIPVQKDGRTVLVDGASIVYASAARGYSYLKLADERLLVTMSLNELERRLRGHFFRAHRSYLVNLDHVRELVPDFQGALVVVMADRQRSRVEVSRRHARELRRRFGM
ncbi:LytTR family two component transcriptional regulator [Isoptericola sp. CG 20/1183]|uniref:LytTR family two component transcriptional regulator n=1 Tax=Isoptericola halotolerans TaxID=300560 RepID=A0ABX5EHC5_9MICO|nr:MULTISPECIES: LytTR family DNA-binding domain-containing protein [Isoptericola]PRZ07645.1 LytTR family two component transcriptional regulator [Isoptericola halotolerans]PRZ07996.1 LytTR family two component transcriptional regulator [Isoptericola sp. CG 20/1183]